MRKRNSFVKIITNFTVLQMLHGCRSDLIMKCLVDSKKDRNL